MLSSRIRAASPAAAVLVLGLVLGGPATASPVAASGTSGGAEQTCESGSVSDAAKMATTVFTGVVESVTREEIDAQQVDFVTTLTVDRVYKPGRGSLIDSESAEILTQSVRGGCGLGALDVGESYVVFADLSGDELIATGDGGTAPADTELVDDVESLLGSGQLPVPPEPPTASFTVVDDSEPVTFARAAVPGAVLVLVGLVGLLLTRRLGRSG